MSKPGINVYRGDFLESQHRIHIAIVNTRGEIIYYYGNPNFNTFARSSMKPIQAVPIIETGAMEAFNFQPEDISLMCASHNGEPIHRERVLSILHRVGQTEEALKCGSHIPRDMESYKALIREGKDLTPVYNNCSGKHAGMIATAVNLNEDIEYYYKSDHPVQLRIIDAISQIAHYPREDIGIGIDGCGVPVHQLPLDRLAFLFASLAHPEIVEDKSRARALTIIRDAMVAHPYYVAGENRFDTDIMEEFDGRLVSKAGAEGVQCIGDIENGIGIAIKTEDGNGRAVSVAMMEVLKQLNIGGKSNFEKLSKYVETAIKNTRKEIIGSIKANFLLEKVRK